MDSEWYGKTADETFREAIPFAIMLGCLLALIFVVAQAKNFYYRWKRKREE